MPESPQEKMFKVGVFFILAFAIFMAMQALLSTVKI
jgi:hypothetical protein